MLITQWSTALVSLFLMRHIHSRTKSLRHIGIFSDKKIMLLYTILFSVAAILSTMIVIIDIQQGLWRETCNYNMHFHGILIQRSLMFLQALVHMTIILMVLTLYQRYSRQLGSRKTDILAESLRGSLENVHGTASEQSRQDRKHLTYVAMADRQIQEVLTTMLSISMFKENSSET